MPDYLYLIIGASVAILTILLSIALFYLIFILRDVNKVVDEIDDTVEKIQDYIMKPISLTNHILTLIKPLVETLQNRGGKKGK